MHPFSAARMVASLTHLYQRKIWVNLVTGSATADMMQLDDRIPKVERYDRLAEYGEIMIKLLGSQLPVSYAGNYYTLEKSNLRTPISKDIFPEFTVAGESEGAMKVKERLNLPVMTMLPAGEISHENAHHRSLAFGIIARPTREAAELASVQMYPPSKFGEKLLQVSMTENETSWKDRIYKEMNGALPSGVHYWLEPFRNKYADCPYLIGSYEALANHLRPCFKHQVHSFMLTIRNESEFEHIQKVFDLI
jgi:alkanesulfonate monooxygenase